MSSFAMTNMPFTHPLDRHRGGDGRGGPHELEAQLQIDGHEILYGK